MSLRSHIGSFADGHLTDALRHLATDPTADPKVRKKVLAVLASWSKQFKDDRSATGIAGLYRQVKPAGPSRRSEANQEPSVERERESEQRRRDKEEAKRREAKEKRVKLEEARRKTAASQTATFRKQFDFEQACFPRACVPQATAPDLHPVQEKPQVLTSIANASSAANNLVNAITVCRSQSRGWLACLSLTEAR